MRRLFSLTLAASFAVNLLGSALPARAALGGVSPTMLKAVHWRLVGPFRGGRAIAVTGVPGHPNRFYFGSVEGGVWESHNAGRTWVPIFDKQHIASIGAIAVAPSDPNVIYVGSGEADMRNSLSLGDGMYVSTDAGKTWKQSGLRHSQSIARIAVDPHNANIAYAAVLGKPYTASTQRGIFKTTDGGASWKRILFHDANTGGIDVTLDPSNPQILFASLWQTRRPPWNIYPPSNGPGSGLYRSTDGGATWMHLKNGLPKVQGRIGVAVSPANPQRVYARVDSDATHGGIYRSDDGGTTWRFMAGGLSQVRIWKRGWYFGEITADPKNPNVVYTMDTSTYRSTDGGKTWIAIKGAPGGDDYHQLWIDPNNPHHMILGSDQGVIVSVDNAKTWSSWYNQTTAQLYHIVTDNRFPYHIYGSQQDSGAVDVPSRSNHLHISARDWKPIDAGGENGYLAVDPNHNRTIFGDALGASAVTVTKERIATGWELNIDPTIAHPSTLFRGTWTLPLVFSPLAGHPLYFAHQRIVRSLDGGKTWQRISPDLTRKNPGAPPNLDAVTIADNPRITRRGVVYAIAPSPRNAKLIWAGTDDGYVWITRDGGKRWKNVTPAALTPWSKVTEIAASHFADGTAYVAVDRHRLGDDAPYLYATSDFGAHWKRIDAGIPAQHFLNAVTEDPQRAGLLYAGTERNVEVSFDSGMHWQSLQRNLPTVSIRDVLVHGDDLVVGTFGRGIWIADGAAALLRQTAGPALTSASWLFAPPLTYRLRPGNDEGTPLPFDEPLANNPPTDVVFTYALNAAATTPLGLAVRDAKGKLLRSWSSASKPISINPASVDVPAYWLTPILPPSTQRGSQRFVWGFHAHDANGPLVPPGRYTVTLTVNGTRQTQAFVIARDPRIHANDADLVAQYQLATTIDERIAQVAKLAKQANAVAKRTSLVGAARARFLRTVLGQAPPANPDDSVGYPSKDFSSLRYLDGAYNNLFADVESADAAPTPTMQQALRKLDAILARTRMMLSKIAH